MTDLIPQFGGTLWTLAAFFVALAVIVTVHEFGHYYIGKLSGIRAEVFSVGFGPRLISRRDRRGTLWQVAAICHKVPRRSRRDTRRGPKPTEKTSARMPDSLPI